MKSSLSPLRSLPVILLLTIAIGPTVTRSPQAVALSRPIEFGTHHKTAPAEAIAQTRDDTTTSEENGTLESMGEKPSFPWWSLWLLGLPLLVLVIWWVLSKETDNQDTGSDIAEGSALKPLAASNDHPQLPPARAIADPTTLLAPGSNQAEGDTDAARAIAAAPTLPALPPSQLILIPEAGRTVRVCWDITAEMKATCRQQGGERLLLQVYDVTDIDPRQEKPHSVQQFDCDETTSELQITVPVGDRRYLADLGYITPDGQWLRLAHSVPTDVAAIPDHSPEPLPQMNTPILTASVDTPNGQAAPVPTPSTIAIISDAIASDSDPNCESDDGNGPGRPPSASFPTHPPTHLWITACGHETVRISWEFPDAIVTYLQRQGIQTLSLLLHDVTWIDLDTCPAHHTERVECGVIERDRTVPIWATDRDYLAELGYTDANGTWVRMARSTHIGIAPA